MKIRAIIEIAGFPEDHVKKTMDMIMGKLSEEKGIKIISKDVAEVNKVKEMWSTFANLELEIDQLDTLNNFCFNYMPSSVEITDPENMNIKSQEIADLLNDLLARLHHFTMFLKNIQAENMDLKNQLKKS